MKPSCSLCISTYNWPSALRLCLLSVLNQSVLPNEIIIGDDGSREETKKLIDSFKINCPIPIKHIWQEDNGFQLAKIRNKSFHACSSDYIIQIDGDVIMHPKFIEDHLTFAKQGNFIAGTKALLPDSYSKQLLETGSFDYQDLYRNTHKKYNATRLFPIAFINYYLQQGIKQYKYVLGANMSFWRKDILSVNGYNEDFSGWGKEDNELSIRLSNAGIVLHFLKFHGIVFHLHHKEADRNNLQLNSKMLEQAIHENLTHISNGIIKH